jgi:hypothetical protein
VHETSGQKTDRSPTMSASQCVSGMKAEMSLICAELEPDQTYMSDWLHEHQAVCILAPLVHPYIDWLYFSIHTGYIVMLIGRLIKRFSCISLN